MEFIIEMDDFGSGYSSLNTLSELPIDVMKLDRLFLYQAENDPRRQKVMQFVIDLAKELHLQVIAEGVETEDQAGLLRKLGCRYAQGFLYGAPCQRRNFLPVWLLPPNKHHSSSEAMLSLFTMEATETGVFPSYST